VLSPIPGIRFAIDNRLDLNFTVVHGDTVLGQSAANNTNWLSATL